MTDTDDAGGWSLVQSRSRIQDPSPTRTATSKSRPREKAIYGTRKDGALRAGPRRHELFVFRVHNDFNDSDVKQFFTDENVTVHELECLSREGSWNKSYRVAVETTDLTPLLQPEFWPDGIGCRRYFKKRVINKPNDGY